MQNLNECVEHKKFRFDDSSGSGKLVCSGSIKVWLNHAPNLLANSQAWVGSRTGSRLKLTKG